MLYLVLSKSAKTIIGHSRFDNFFNYDLVRILYFFRNNCDRQHRSHNSQKHDHRLIGAERIQSSSHREVGMTSFPLLIAVVQFSLYLGEIPENSPSGTAVKLDNPLAITDGDRGSMATPQFTSNDLS